MAGDADWHYSTHGEKYGPVSARELRRLVADGEVAEDDLVWTPGMADWQRADRVDGLLPEPARRDRRPPRRDRDRDYRADDYDDVRAFAEKKTLAGVFGILMGAFGIHKFILGMPGPGLIMLGMSLFGLAGGLIGLFCLITLPLLLVPTAMGTIGLVEGILYLSKTDAEFYRLYAVEKKGWF